MSSTKSKEGSSTDYLHQASSSDTLDPTHLQNNISDDTKKETRTSKPHSIMSCLGTWLRLLRLEIMAFIFTFSYRMTYITSTAMIIDKVCLVHFGYSSSICSNLSNFTIEKTLVEKLATNYQLGHSLLQVAPAAVLACFVGPWSELYGRKFPIILALVGMTLDAIGSSVCAYFLETRVDYYLIPAVFTGLLGGHVSIVAILYSYASDLTQFAQRTMKYAFLEMALGFSIPLGALAGGWIFEFLGYFAVFLFSMGGLILSLIWVTFLLEETRGLDNDDSWSVKLRKLFSCGTFVDSFRAVAKERPHKGRTKVILLIISMCCLVITYNSTGDIDYLYVHHQYGWSNAQFSTIVSIYSIISIVVLIIVVPLIVRYKIGDPWLGITGTVSMLGKSIGTGLAWKQSVYHIASSLGLVTGFATFAPRSLISKVVSNDDLGKVFPFVAAAQFLLPVVATVLVSQLFSAVLGIFPGMPYIILAIFLILPLTVFGWMTRLPKMSSGDPNLTTKGTEDVYSST